MLQIVDAQWKDHLYSLDHLKEGIGLRGYGQRDPLVEYKKESFALFSADEGPRRGRDRPLPVAADAGDRRRAPTARSFPRARPAPRKPPQMTLNAPSAQASSPFGAIRGDRRRRRAGARRAAAPGAHRRRRRRPSGEARRAQGRPQRSLPVRQRQEIQEVPWGLTHEPERHKAANVAAHRL